MIAAMILAGGLASRAGGPKMTWKIGRKPSVRRVAEAALGAAEIALVTVVTGAWPEEVNAALKDLPLTIIHNPGYAGGQSGSVKVGLSALPEETRAVIFLLADQPFITSQILADLVKFYEESKALIVVPSFQGKRMNPALFDLARYREDLMGLSGDQGGRSIIKANPDDVAALACDSLDPKIFADFDTLEEYEKLSCLI